MLFFHIFFIEVSYVDVDHFEREREVQMLSFKEVKVRLPICSFGCNLCSCVLIFDMRQLLQFILRNTAASAVQLEKFCGFLAVLH